MLKTPTREQIAEIIKGLGISASDDDVSLYRDLVEGSIAGRWLVHSGPVTKHNQRVLV